MNRLDDIQEAIQAAKQHTSVLIPPPTAEAMPEEQAWKMIAAEGGGTLAMLAIAVTVIWRKLSANQTKQEELAEKRLEEARAHNKQLVETQAAAIVDLSKAMIRVESAVQMSDANNTNAIGKLSDTVNATIVRLDKHEAKIEAASTNLLEHSHRLQVLESGSHRVLPPVPTRKPKP